MVRHQQAASGVCMRPGSQIVADVYRIVARLCVFLALTARADADPGDHERWSHREVQMLDATQGTRMFRSAQPDGLAAQAAVGR